MFLFSLVALAFAAQPRLTAQGIAVGALQTTAEHAADSHAAGLRLAVLDLSWESFEPKPGERNPAYLEKVRAKLQALRDAGLQVIIEPGVQYPPAWLFEIPNSRYVNQFYAEYKSTESGKNVANSVFNQSVRARQAEYYRLIFEELGTEFYAFRVGGGWYNELSYPEHRYGGQENCYWAYDFIAQGEVDGLPPGIPKCPVPGWKPGENSPGNESAGSFIAWYISALADYQEWQIRTVRRYFPGRISVLYPSWGIRPTQLAVAIKGDLNGTTSPEINGEIPKGLDFELLVRSITDPKVGLHCTWLDADPEFASDSAGAPVEAYSPIRYLRTVMLARDSSLGPFARTAASARAQSTPLELSGENTGNGNMETLELCVRRARKYQLSHFLWAFEGDLVNGQAPELTDLGKAFR